MKNDYFSGDEQTDKLRNLGQLCYVFQQKPPQDDTMEARKYVADLRSSETIVKTINEGTITFPKKKQMN